VDDEVRDPSMILLKTVRAVGDAIMRPLTMCKISCSFDHGLCVSGGGGVTGRCEIGKHVSKVSLDLGVSLNLGLIGSRQVGDLSQVVIAGAVCASQFPEGAFRGLLHEDKSILNGGVSGCTHKDAEGRAGGHSAGGEFSILNAEVGELKTWRNGDGCLGKTAGWEDGGSGLRGH
jgi:hypothetical protein